MTDERNKELTQPCKDGTHNRIVRDYFAEEIGRRLVPGNCFCLDCKQPIPADWNNGRPKAIEERQD